MADIATDGAASVTPRENARPIKNRKLASERTVILVEHKMKLVLGISDRILVLHHGELLAEGTPQEVRQNEAVKRVYLGQREH